MYFIGEKMKKMIIDLTLQILLGIVVFSIYITNNLVLFDKYTNVWLVGWDYFLLTLVLLHISFYTWHVFNNIFIAIAGKIYKNYILMIPVYPICIIKGNIKLNINIFRYFENKRVLFNVDEIIDDEACEIFIKNSKIIEKTERRMSLALSLFFICLFFYTNNYIVLFMGVTGVAKKIPHYTKYLFYNEESDLIIMKNYAYKESYVNELIYSDRKNLYLINKYLAKILEEQELNIYNYLQYDYLTLIILFLNQYEETIDSEIISKINKNVKYKILQRTLDITSRSAVFDFLDTQIVCDYKNNGLEILDLYMSSSWDGINIPKVIKDRYENLCGYIKGRNEISVTEKFNWINTNVIYKLK